MKGPGIGDFVRLKREVVTFSGRRGAAGELMLVAEVRRGKLDLCQPNGTGPMLYAIRKAWISRAGVPKRGAVIRQWGGPGPAPEPHPPASVLVTVEATPRPPLTFTICSTEVLR